MPRERDRLNERHRHLSDPEKAPVQGPNRRQIEVDYLESLEFVFVWTRACSQRTLLRYEGLADLRAGYREIRDSFLKVGGTAIDAKRVNGYLDYVAPTERRLWEIEDETLAYRRGCEILDKHLHSEKVHARLMHNFTNEYSYFKLKYLEEEREHEGFKHDPKLLEKFRRIERDEYPTLPTRSDAFIVRRTVELKMIAHRLDYMSEGRLSVPYIPSLREPQRVNKPKKPTRTRKKKKSDRKNDDSACVVMSVAKDDTLLEPQLSQRRMNIYQV